MLEKHAIIGPPVPLACRAFPSFQRQHRHGGQLAMAEQQQHRQRIEFETRPRRGQTRSHRQAWRAAATLLRSRSDRSVRSPAATAGPCLPRRESCCYFPSSPEGLNPAAPRIAFSVPSRLALCPDPPNPWLRNAGAEPSPPPAPRLLTLPRSRDESPGNDTIQGKKVLFMCWYICGTLYRLLTSTVQPY